MALIAELYRPKIGLVPVGGRFTMDGATAALAVKRYFDFDMAVPCHYGTFDVLAPDASQFLAAMQGANTKVWTGGIGRVWRFERSGHYTRNPGLYGIDYINAAGRIPSPLRGGWPREAGSGGGPPAESLLLWPPPP